jgi:hypothetical protein
VFDSVVGNRVRIANGAKKRSEGWMRTMFFVVGGCFVSSRQLARASGALNRFGDCFLNCSTGGVVRLGPVKRPTDRCF